MISDGNKSLVNWIRWKELSRDRARQWAKVGLSNTRDIFDQEVTAAQERDNGELDHVALPLNHLLDIVLKFFDFGRAIHKKNLQAILV